MKCLLMTDSNAVHRYFARETGIGHQAVNLRAGVLQRFTGPASRAPRGDRNAVWCTMNHISTRTTTKSLNRNLCVSWQIRRAWPAASTGTHRPPGRRRQLAAGAAPDARHRLQFAIPDAAVLGPRARGAVQRSLRRAGRAGHPPAPGGEVPAMLPAPLAAARAAFEQALGGAAVQQPRQTLAFVGAGGPARREFDLFFTPIRDAARHRRRRAVRAGAQRAGGSSATTPPACASWWSRTISIPSTWCAKCCTAFGHDNDGVAAWRSGAGKAGRRPLQRAVYRRQPARHLGRRAGAPRAVGRSPA